MIDEVLPDALDGERLDRVITMLDGCSRSAAAALVADGKVAVDGIVVRQRSVRVAAGQRVTFAPTEQAVATVDPDPAIDVPIVYHDGDVIVVNKPAGLIVHPGAGRPDGTLVNGLLAAFPEIDGVGQDGRPGIVHRLDGDTSGLLVVARTSSAYEALTAAMARHDVERIYTAVVSGLVTDERGVVDAPIGRSTQRRTRMAVVADGREARTHYQVLARDPEDPPASLLRCQLETGRTHQIRVHLSAIGHPVFGDQTYGDRTSKAGLDRVALHARQLAFAHPITGELLSFEAPLPDDLQSLIDRRFPAAP